MANKSQLIKLRRKQSVSIVVVVADTAENGKIPSFYYWEISLMSDITAHLEHEKTIFIIALQASQDVIKRLKKLIEHSKASATKSHQR